MPVSLIQEISIIDCALQLISVRIWFEERLFCLTETCIEVTVQIATKAPSPPWRDIRRFVCVYILMIDTGYWEPLLL
jgi:hypothetical protein